MEKTDDKSQNPQNQSGVSKITEAKAAEKAAIQADANSGTESKTPEEAAKSEAESASATEQQRIANAIAAVRSANPDLSIDDVATLVAKAFAKTDDSIQAKVDKQAATVLDTTPNPFKEKVFLKKDVNKQFPLEKEALNGIVVRQSYQKTTEEGDSINVPARNLSELAIYSQEEFDKLNHGDPNKPGFARMGLTVEVWHKPSQTATIAE